MLRAVALHQRPGRRASWLRVPWLVRFVDSYGWRAYAIPVLSVATILVVIEPHASRAAHSLVARSAAVAHVRSATHREPPARPERLRSAPTRHAAVSKCVGNTDAERILVSISKQRAWMCSRNHEVRTSAVTTGEVVNGDATPTGTWEIYAKQTNRYLNGPGYHDYVRYWMPFHGDFGFHDASWQKMSFGSADYRTRGSHGCVHLPTNVMAWLYSWASVGATVTVTA